MSLLRPIIRACAVAALRDKTWAEDRVFDSDQTPLAEAVLGTAAKPYIVVYTDVDDNSPIIGPNQIYSGENRALSLVLEMGVASAIRGEKGEIIIQFAATDAGMEWAVDILESQALAALIGDPRSKWGELFKRLIWRVTKIPSKRGGQAEKGVRFAARRTTLVCSTLHEIPPGMVPKEEHPVRQFIKMARENPDVAVVDAASIVEYVLDTTEAPNWRIAQSYLGTYTDSARKLMVPGAPLPYPEAPEIPAYDDFDTNEYPPDLLDIILRDERPTYSLHYASADFKASSGVVGDAGA